MALRDYIDCYCIHVCGAYKITAFGFVHPKTTLFLLYVQLYHTPTCPPAHRVDGPGSREVYKLIIIINIRYVKSIQCAYNLYSNCGLFMGLLFRDYFSLAVAVWQHSASRYRCCWKKEGTRIFKHFYSAWSLHGSSMPVLFLLCSCSLAVLQLTLLQLMMWMVVALTKRRYTYMYT